MGLFQHCACSHSPIFFEYGNGMFLADNVDLSADKIDADPLILPGGDGGKAADV